MRGSIGEFLDILFIGMFLIMSIFRTYFMAKFAHIEIRFNTSIYVSFLTLIATLGIGLVLYPIVFYLALGAVSMPIIVITISVLLCLAIVPGYYIEKRLLKGRGFDESNCRSIARNGYVYSTILGVLLIYSMYTVAMKFF